MSCLAVAACGGAGDDTAGTETESEGSDDSANSRPNDDNFDSFPDDGGDGFPDDGGDDFPDDGDDRDDDDNDNNDNNDNDNDPDSESGAMTDTGTAGGTADTAADTAAETGNDSGTDTNGMDAGDCCEPHVASGCEVDDVQSCVCDEDPFCCDRSWDPICTVLVVTQSCGSCSNIGGDGDCCMAGETPGCDDNEVEACVCEMDTACCLDTWDMLCVQLVEAGCGQC